MQRKKDHEGLREFEKKSTTQKQKDQQDKGRVPDQQNRLKEQENQRRQKKHSVPFGREC
ncbi:hypothetical protein KR50_07950 [Jeotgalibacillus campisalis]|uniref:Uncharacterized protein n=1 Tax=Jeotgalibacillus campisalis TaxID=220754 RepID=A0A0C2SAC7_9BACL|nr:hypothetical protein KR50_07950 [Jeotgalibacillus campisalis]